VPARPAPLQKGRHQGPALAALVDWGAGVEQDGAQAARPTAWRAWAKEGLCPVASWEHRSAPPRTVHAAQPRGGRPGSGTVRVPHACPAQPAAGASPGGLGHVGEAAGPCLAACLLRWRMPPQRASATPSQPAGGTQATVEGLDDPANLRWSGRRGPDTHRGLLRSGVARAFGDRLTSD
jgi:hypothetical protein